MAPELRCRYQLWAGIVTPLKRYFKTIAICWVLLVLAALVPAGPVAAGAMPLADDRVAVPETGNATAMATWRNGDFVYIVSEGTDLSAAADTMSLITPRPIGPSGISVKSLMPGFAWASVLGATEYSFELYTDVDLNQKVTSFKTTAPAVALTQPLTAGEDYYWTVRVTQPAVSNRSWATFHVSTLATAPVVPVTTVAASRPRAAYSGRADTVPQPTALLFEANAAAAPAPIVLTVRAPAAPAAAPATAAAPVTAALPVVFVIGVLLLSGVLTLILRPHICD